ncbi:MAG: ATP-binding cassette domain-containing protein [Rubellimicrobium sp.]|nr:ATP-binding cassette domain-containing protein [Rubellimicrobium sp.]
MGLTLEGLDLTWGDFTLCADFTVTEGSVIAVIGPSGAGKSSLLSAIAGFAPPGRGRILWQGHEIGALAPWERPVAVLFQDSNLFPHLDVTRNLALALDPSRRPDAPQKARIADALGAVGLAGFGERMPGQLSGGQLSRAALARVLLQDRPVVLLDEPFAALGPGQKDEMLRLAAGHLRRAGRTVLMVTHDPQEARAVADGIVTVIGGRATGPHPVAILDDPAGPLAEYLGHARMPR